MRVQIKPGLRRVWRGPGTVQIGLDPSRGMLVEGVTEADRELVEGLLHGNRPVPAPNRSGNAGWSRRRELLDLLDGGSVLVRAAAGRAALARLGTARARLAPDAAVWSVVHPSAGDGWELLAARTARSVEIRGGGRTVNALAAALAAAGVGAVRLRCDRPVRIEDVGPAGPWPEDVGLPAAAAPPEALRRLGGRPPADGARSATAPPDLVVLVDRYTADAQRADGLLRQDLAHLSVVIGEAGGVVGPLVVPGEGPCLRCLDLHRADRDPGWPRVLAQLLDRPGAVGDAGAARGDARPADDPGTEEAASSGLTASLAALQVLARLDGLSRPASLGATLEVELPDGLVARRPWPAHASCGCTWPPPSTAGAGLPDDPTAAAGPAQDGRRGS